MPPFVNPLDPRLGMRRVKRRITVIETGIAEISSLEREETTEMTSTGDFETTVSEHLVNISGELVPLHQAVAMCSECGGLQTARTVLRCFFCGRVICRTCATWFSTDGENRPICPACNRSLRWHQFWGRVGGLIASCFLTRRTPE